MDKKMTIATIGTFDGVHIGHVALLDELKALATAIGMHPSVITFDPNPISVLRPDSAPKNLMVVSDRIATVRNLGISDVILLSFTKELSMLTAEEFMLLLRDKYSVHALLVGYDHHFGRGAKLTFEEYQRIGNRIGMQVFQAKPLILNDRAVSSSRIREALLSNNLTLANSLLGRAYRLNGQVVGGLQIGRSLGYPTANIKPTNSELLIPADGVYAVRIELDQCVCGEHSSTHYGMLSIGNRPTLSDNLSRTIEVHIFDIEVNLYAQHLTIIFERFIRMNQRFSSLEALQKQIADDELVIRSYFSIN